MSFPSDTRERLGNGSKWAVWLGVALVMYVLSAAPLQVLGIRSGSARWYRATTMYYKPVQKLAACSAWLEDQSTAYYQWWYQKLMPPPVNRGSLF